MDVGRFAARGASHLFMGKILSSLIGLVGSLLVIRLLDATSYGLISVAMIVPGIFTILGDVGLSQAIIKFLASSHRSESRRSQIGTILIYDIVLGAALTVACFYSSSWLDTKLFGKPEAVQLAGVASFVVFASTVYNGIWSILIGLDATRYNATMLITNYTVQSFVAPALILSGMGPLGAIYGYVLAPLSAAILGASFLVAHSYVGKGTIHDLRTMLRYGAPLAGAAALAGLQGQIYNVLLATYAAIGTIGNFTAATKFSIIFDIAMTPVTTVLFPAFAKLKGSENERVSASFRSSITYSSILVVPLGMGAIALSKPLTEFILGPSYPSAWIFLALTAAAWLYAGFGLPIVNLLLAGQGETDLVFLLSIVNVITGGVAGFVMIPFLGAMGVPLASLVSIWPQYLLGIRALKQKFGVRLPMGKIARLFAASFLAVAPSIILSMTRLGSVWQIGVGILSACLIYLVAVPRLRVLDDFDMGFLTESLSQVPIAGTVALRILAFLRRFMPETR